MLVSKSKRCFHLSISPVKKQETHITGDLSAFLAGEKWNVLMVQLVTCCLSLIPTQFVKFLKEYDLVRKSKEAHSKMCTINKIKINAL